MSTLIELEIKHDCAYIANMFNEMAGDTDRLMDDILRTAANYQTRTTKARFGKQMGPDNKPWPPLSPLTIKARRKGKGRAGRGHKRLLDRGDLRRSIVPERTIRREIKVRTNKPYARYQNDGATWTITKKQAWWIVFNLYGFDPDKPWKWGISKKERKYLNQLEESDAARDVVSRHNWFRAYKLFKKIVGSKARIPAAPFMGIDTDDILKIDEIAQRHVDRFIRTRGRR